MTRTFKSANNIYYFKLFSKIAIYAVRFEGWTFICQWKIVIAFFWANKQQQWQVCNNVFMKNFLNVQKWMCLQERNDNRPFDSEQTTIQGSFRCLLSSSVLIYAQIFIFTKHQIFKMKNVSTSKHHLLFCER